MGGVSTIARTGNAGSASMGGPTAPQGDGVVTYVSVSSTSPVPFTVAGGATPVIVEVGADSNTVVVDGAAVELARIKPNYPITIIYSNLTFFDC